MEKILIAILSLVGIGGCVQSEDDKPDFFQAGYEQKSPNHRKPMRPGMELRYQCGCSWMVGHIHYGSACPPPLLCHTHGYAWDDYKWPKEWQPAKKERHPDTLCSDVK